MLPRDLLYIIINNIKNKRDLVVLSLVSRECYVAIHEIYDYIYVDLYKDLICDLYDSDYNYDNNKKYNIKNNNIKNKDIKNNNIKNKDIKNKDIKNKKYNLQYYKSDCTSNEFYEISLNKRIFELNFDLPKCNTSPYKFIYNINIINLESAYRVTIKNCDNIWNIKGILNNKLHEVNIISCGFIRDLYLLCDIPIVNIHNTKYMLYNILSEQNESMFYKLIGKIMDSSMKDIKVKSLNGNQLKIYQFYNYNCNSNIDLGYNSNSIYKFII